ncbi:hypothetical protein LINPERPRIM_LOCUS16408 [Linum perenne]
MAVAATSQGIATVRSSRISLSSAKTLGFESLYFCKKDALFSTIHMSLLRYERIHFQQQLLGSLVLSVMMVEIQYHLVELIKNVTFEIVGLFTWGSLHWIEHGKTRLNKLEKKMNKPLYALQMVFMDIEVNNRKVKVHEGGVFEETDEWKNLRVGDVVKVETGSGLFPARN